MEVRNVGVGPGLRLRLRESSPGVGRTVGRIFVGLGALLLVVTAFVAWREQTFLARAVQTRGLVVALRSSYGTDSHGRTSRTPTYSPTFTFADANEVEHRVEAHTSTNPPAYQVGENVDVFYLPEAPDRAQLRGWFAQWGATMICGALGTFFFLFGALFSLLFATQARQAGMVRSIPPSP